VADGVDATMDPMQAAPRDAPVDRRVLEPERAQLRPRHHAVLGRRELRQRPSDGGCGEFSSPGEDFSTHP
jgi:hypothetical protein